MSLAVNEAKISRARAMRCSAASVAHAARSNLLVGSAMQSVCHWLAALSKMLADLVLLNISRCSSCGGRALRQAVPCRFVRSFELLIDNPFSEDCRKQVCKHLSSPLAMSPLTMIAAALTIFRSGLFRAFTLIVHLILQNKITGYLWTRDPRYWRVIAVTVLLSPRLAARSFPGWARPRAKHGRHSPTAIITGRWPESCGNWRA